MKINLMAKFGRRLVCLTLTEVYCDQPLLPLIVSENGLPLATNFTTFVEVATGVTIGTSTADHARTIQAA